VFVQDKWGLSDYSLQLKKPQQHIVKYGVKLGDEMIQAPLSLFFPDMMGLTGEKLAHVQSRGNGDPQDPHDEFYLRQTQRAHVQQDPVSGYMYHVLVFNDRRRARERTTRPIKRVHVQDPAPGL
jgi:hypothetical protein